MNSFRVDMHKNMKIKRGAPKQVAIEE